MEQMRIGIVGLGLIGGSMAKAIKANTKHIVIGYEIDDETLRRAEKEGTVDCAQGTTGCFPRSTCCWLPCIRGKQ